jgi:uncharacterized membrane protein
MEEILPRRNLKRAAGNQWIFGMIGGALVAYGLKRGSLLGTILAYVGGDVLSFGLSGHHLHELLGIGGVAHQDGASRLKHQRGIIVEHSVDIKTPPEVAYTLMRNLENLPTFMNHVQAVRVLDEKHSHWIVHGPANTQLEWDAEIINDIPNKLIAWRSVDCPEVDHAGSVQFKRDHQGTGTRVRVRLQYLPPAGALGTVIAKLFAEEPEVQIAEDLGRLKAVLESEPPSSTASVAAGGSF